MNPRYLFVVNPSSGAGKGEAIAGLLRKLLPRHPSLGGSEVILTDRLETSALAEKLARAEAVVAVGGDGTASRLIPHILACEEPPALGLIPLGTSNDLARALDMPVDEDYSEEQALRSTLDRLLDAGEGRLDVFSVNEKLLFCNYFGVGLDAAIVRDFDGARRSRWAKLLPPGRMTNNLLYFIMGLKNLRFYVNPPVEIDCADGARESERLTIDSRCRAIIVTNLGVYAGGCPIRADARKDDGMFEITVIYSAYQFVKLIVTRFLPFLGLPRGLGRFQARRAAIHLSSPTPSQIDGEKCFEADGTAPILEISFRSSLRILIPSATM